MPPGTEKHGHKQKLCVYSLSFLGQRQVRRILELSGYQITTGWPGRSDAVAVWGQRPVSRRGRWVANRFQVPLIHLEDGFLRSVYPSVMGDDPLSLVIDDVGIYFDGSRPSRLEQILESSDFGSDALQRAQKGIDALLKARLSKYTPPVSKKTVGTDYVLVVDQTYGDASIHGAGCDASTFAQMLDAARVEHPNARIVIKSHPDVIAGKRAGHYSLENLQGDVDLIVDEINPWDAINGADAVYTVSSQMGYEAILAGKQVRCFGQAFYAGWGLTDDEIKSSRRTRSLSREALFAGCHLDYPTYYDPWNDCLCDFETALWVLQTLHAAEAQPISQAGEAFLGVRLWKRQSVASFRPRHGPKPQFLTSDKDAATARGNGRDVWMWASKAPIDAKKGRGGFIEDGFLRSVGLGAELTEASSLVFDRTGIYFDPAHPSDLETLIAEAAEGCADRGRAKALRDMIVETGVTKYNVGTDGKSEKVRNGTVILVPGQVEDDASILRGCGEVRTNLGLLRAAREANPDAWLIYKPHPDVEAGLRAGAIDRQVAASLANEVADRTSAAALLKKSDAVWTLTSLMGFEALMRGIPVTCLGTPFYAGWGLTEDLGPPIARRTAKPTLDDVVWAALIAYPLYRDPVTRLPCPPEVIVQRLAAGVPHRRASILSKLQALFSGFHELWR